MQRLVVLGGGTAGTMVANRLRRRLGREGWSVTVVDRDDEHLYQPGLLLLPFGAYAPGDLVRRRDRVDADAGVVHLVAADFIEKTAGAQLLFV